MPSDSNPVPSLADQNQAMKSVHAASSQADAQPPEPDPSDSGAGTTPAPDGTEVVPSPS